MNAGAPSAHFNGLLNKDMNKSMILLNKVKLVKFIFFTMLFRWACDLLCGSAMNPTGQRLTRIMKIENGSYSSIERCHVVHPPAFLSTFSLIPFSR